MHPSPDVLALLALGEEADTPEERAHIESCTECQSEIADLARVVAVGRQGGPDDSGLVTPPDRVWQAIRSELGFTSQAAEPSSRRELPDVATVTTLPRSAGPETNGAEPPATVTPISAAPSRSSRGRRGLALLVAAAVALVLGVGLGLGLDRILGPRQTVLWTADLQALPAFSGSTGEASVVEDRDGNRMLVIELDSPEPVDGSRQVWLIDRGVTKMRSLGYLTGDTARLNIPADLDPHQFPVVDVSKEPPADPDIAHSGNSIVRGNLNV
jgi:hypothetical protein